MVARFTEEELHDIWSFAKETPGQDIDPKSLISMVEEIRVSRTTSKSVGERLMKLDGTGRSDLVELVGLAINTQDEEEFAGCLRTIGELLFPELMGKIVFHKQDAIDEKT